MRTLILVLAALALADAARADPCGDVLDAFRRFADAPTVHEEVRSDTETIEVVFIGGKMHMKHGGAWQVVPDDGEDVRKEMLATMQAGIGDCHEVGTDTIDGASMTVYGYTPPSDEDGDTQDPQRVWVGTDGLPYRMTGTVEDDAVDIGLRYTGVTAPE